MSDFTILLPLPGAFIDGGFKAIYDGDNGPYEHAGIDIRYSTPTLTLGAPIIACADGNLITHRPGDGWGNGSFGVCRVIDHVDTPYWTICAHMMDERFPAPDGPVKQGQVIGRVGMTGLTSGPHTHFALSQGDGGAFDPARFKDLDGVWRIGNKKLLDPAPFLREAAPTKPVPTNAELDYSLGELNTVVIEQGKRITALEQLARAQREQIARLIGD